MDQPRVKLLAPESCRECGRPYIWHLAKSESKTYALQLLDRRTCKNHSQLAKPEPGVEIHSELELDSLYIDSSCEWIT